MADNNQNQTQPNFPGFTADYFKNLGTDTTQSNTPTSGSDENVVAGSASATSTSSSVSDEDLLAESKSSDSNIPLSGSEDAIIGNEPAPTKTAPASVASDENLDLTATSDSSSSAPTSESSSAESSEASSASSEQPVESTASSSAPVTGFTSADFKDIQTSVNDAHGAPLQTQTTQTTPQNNDYQKFDMLNTVKPQAPEVREQQIQAPTNPNGNIKRLKYHDHQTLLLMSLQKLKDPSTGEPLLENKDLVQNLGNNRQEAHDKLAATTSNFKDLGKLGIPKLESALVQGTLTPQTWETAKKDAFKEADQAERLDDYATKYRTVKDKPIEAVNFTDPEYPDNLWADKKKDFPAVLSYQGDKKLLNAKPSIAVAGSQHIDDAVGTVAYNYGAKVSIDGFNTVTGLANGSDTQAVKGNLAYLDILKEKNPQGYEAAGKPVVVLAKGLNTTLTPKANIQLANDVVNHGGVIISPESPNNHPLNREYFNQVVDRSKLEGKLADAVISTQTGKGPGSSGRGSFPDDSSSTLLSAIDQNRPMAMLDPNQLSALQGQPQGEKFLYNELNIARGKAIPLGSVMGTQQVANQFANLEDAAVKRNQFRKDHMYDAAKPQGKDPKGPNNGNNGGIDF